MSGELRKPIGPFGIYPELILNLELTRDETGQAVKGQLSGDRVIKALKELAKALLPRDEMQSTVELSGDMLFAQEGCMASYSGCELNFKIKTKFLGYKDKRSIRIVVMEE